jgi:CheY-like chemotaxis protein
MDGAGVLTLRARLCAEPPRWTGLTPSADGFAYIAVEDTGPGIPAALRERVFEPFFSTKGREGTGMGLAVAQSIVLDHGGTIRAVSRAEGGTAFEVVLPLSEGRAIAGRPSAESVSSLETIRVLVVDDDPLARSAEVALLVHLGCEIEACVDGRSALDRLVGDLPDLVVLDVDMPGIDGFEVLTWLRQRHPELPVLLVTGLGGAEVAERALALGAKRVLRKPLGLAELRRAVQAAVGPSAQP